MLTWVCLTVELFQNHRGLIWELHHQIKPSTYGLDIVAERREQQIRTFFHLCDRYLAFAESLRQMRLGHVLCPGASLSGSCRQPEGGPFRP